VIDDLPRPGSRRTTTPSHAGFSETEECGPFTLFLGEPAGWVYCARPRLGETAAVTPEDVVAAADWLRERGLPQTIEWVHETTPTLLDAVHAAGSFELEELPLLVLDGDLTVTPRCRTASRCGCSARTMPMR
jgi:hypothetical protein